MENYRDSFALWLVPIWGQERFDEWWATPIKTLSGSLTPHEICLFGLSSQLRDDVRAKIEAEKCPKGLIRDCQAILASYLANSTADPKATISDLLELLDGPRARAALAS
jgi:hypothetical protein